MSTLTTVAPGDVLPDSAGADPQERLNTLLTRLDAMLRTVEPVLPMIQQAPDMVAMAVDTFDDLVAQGKRDGIDLDERLRASLHVLERLTHPDTMRRLELLLDRLPALEALLPMLDSMPEALARAQRSARPLGLFGVVGAMSDPRVQRTVGLALATVRELGTATPSGAPRT